MSLTNPNEPYMLRVTWAENNESKEQITTVSMAGKLLHELEIRKGIKGKFFLIN